MIVDALHDEAGEQLLDRVVGQAALEEEDARFHEILGLLRPRTHGSFEGAPLDNIVDLRTQ